MTISRQETNNLSNAKLIFGFFAVVVTLIILSGRAIKLAPDYDTSIIDGLTKANEQTLILFARVSSGVSSNSYSKREKAYNTQIGKFEAIAIQIEARPLPRSRIQQVFGIGPPIGTEPKDLPVLEDAPSLQPVQEIVFILTRMQNQDRTRRLSHGAIAGLKSAYKLSIDQALTYEKALER